jgi:rhodanese-related sulfurtransferase
MKSIQFITAAIALLFSVTLISGQVTAISPNDLKTLINNCNYSSDYILLDVRDNSEVKDGIIASDYCKPYHMSWNSGVLKAGYTVLPKEMPIYVYCKSGNRSGQAAKFLSDSGYTKVFSMTGGISSYTGTLHDSTDFKALTKLPEPSFFKDKCQTALSRSPTVRRAPLPDSRRQCFTLQGRLVTQLSPLNNAPVYILERIGDENGRKNVGLHQLILK